MMEERSCSRHGKTQFALHGTPAYWRCLQCLSENVTTHRKRNRLILIKEAGGKCIACGYNRALNALQFHHLDPKTKEFGLSGKGQTYSLERQRKEAAKCVLLCANCHAEVESGLLVL